MSAEELETPAEEAIIMSAEESATPAEAIGSPLGTQEYWDEIYQRDKVNFADHGDAGEVWWASVICG